MVSSFVNDLSTVIFSTEQPIIGSITLIGTIVVLLLINKVIQSTYKTFLQSSLSSKALTSKLGKWVVITGATDGIGLAYAHLFAKQGCSILLISRTESKLQAVQQELLTKYGSSGSTIEVQYIVCDYSKPSTEYKQMIQTKLEAIAATSTIGILINNVGVSYKYPLFVHELSDEEVSTMIQMNIMSVVTMTRLVLPIMMKQKSGTIINLSSGSALYTLPLLAVYSGTKSFVEKFSRAIHAEYSKSYNITCQCQVPFYVATKLAKMRPSITVPSPKAYVQMAYKWIGGPPSSDVIVSPFYIHAIQGYIMYYIPEFILVPIIMGMHLTIRKKGIAKDAKLAAETKKN